MTGTCRIGVVYGGGARGNIGLRMVGREHVGEETDVGSTTTRRRGPPMG